MTRNKLIAFCYLFIVGIGFAMLHPAGPDALPALWGATGLLGLATIAAFAFVYRRPPDLDEALSLHGAPPPDRKQVALWVLMLLAAAVFGYTRYIAFIQSPDTLVGTLAVAPNSQAWTPGRIVVAGLLSGFLVGRGQPLSRMDGARWLQMASTMSSMFAVLRAAAMDAATPAEADAEVAQAAPAQTASPAPGPVQPPPAEAATEVSER